MLEKLCRRFLAFIVDYFVVVLYALLLFGFSNLLLTFFGVYNRIASPICGQTIGFLTLTLPVFLYFYLWEKSNWQGTPGKILLKIRVVADQPDTEDRKSILIRNILKFLPWEIAHTGVHWLVFYSTKEIDPPLWVWILLILPQIIVFGYFVSIIVFRGESSFYDKGAGSKIEIKKEQNIH